MESMEDKIRSVLRTEIQEPQAALLPNSVYEPSRQLKGLPESGGISGVFKLRFVGAERPKDTLYTGYPVQWQNGENVKVAIFLNEKQVTNGDLSKLQIEIVLVHADFFTERGQENFTKEEFNKQIYSDKGKESVLTTVNLTNGEAYLASFCFRESSYGKKLRLTARMKRQDPAIRVQEAITDPFVVKDRRSESNAKSHFPSKEDEVHRLKKISPKGKRCDALAGKRITKVKHLMRQYHKDKCGLQELNNWKISAYKRFEERENSGDLIPDYWMSNGFPVHAVALNNDAGPSVQARMPCQYLNDMAAQHEFGEQHPFRQQNVFSPAKVLSNNDAGPSKQEAPLFSQHNAQQDLGQHGPSMPQNGTLYCHLTQGNILNGPGSLPAQPAIPSYNFPPVPEDVLITGASLASQQNGYLSSSTSDAPGTSYPVTDGVSQRTTSLNHVEADIFSGLIEALLGDEEAPGVDLDVILANNEQLPNSDNQFHGYEHDDDNW